jgi:hypothetical protein
MLLYARGIGDSPNLGGVVALPLGVQTVLTAACLWLGLALLVVTLLFVRGRRRFWTLLCTGIALVGLAIVLMVGMFGFGPEVAVP